MPRKFDSLTLKQMTNNIRIMYVTGGLMWARFFVPILALFYIASQVSLAEFAIIMSVFSLATLIFEIPSGVIADLMGKKNALILSRALYVIEIIILAFCNGFWPFLIAKIISGIGVSLSSGTSEALLFESLKKIGREKDYKKIAGKSSIITNITTALVFIIGAWMFTTNSKLPAMASWPLVLVGFFLTFFITEPYHNKRNLTLKNSVKQLKESVRFFFKNDYLVFMGLMTLAIGTIVSLGLSLSSAYLSGIMIPVAFMGVIAFISRLVPAWSSKNADKYDKKYGDKKMLLYTYIIALAGIFLMALMIPYVGVVFFLFLPFVEGLFGITTTFYINNHVGSAHRTTVISINNAFDNIGIFILFPLIGYVIKANSMTAGFALLGVFFLLYGMVLLSYVRIANIFKT